MMVTSSIGRTREEEEEEVRSQGNAVALKKQQQNYHENSHSIDTLIERGEDFYSAQSEEEEEEEEEEMEKEGRLVVRHEESQQQPLPKGRPLIRRQDEGEREREREEQDFNNNINNKAMPVLDQINKMKKRNKEMHKRFVGLIPPEDLCLADFPASLIQKSGMPLLGKLYLTSHHLLFHSYLPLGSGPTLKALHISRIQDMFLPPPHNLLSTLGGGGSSTVVITCKPESSSTSSPSSSARTSTSDPNYQYTKRNQITLNDQPQGGEEDGNSKFCETWTLHLFLISQCKRMCGCLNVVRRAHADLTERALPHQHPDEEGEGGHGHVRVSRRVQKRLSLYIEGRAQLREEGGEDVGSEDEEEEFNFAEGEEDIEEEERSPRERRGRPPLLTFFNRTGNNNHIAGTENHHHNTNNLNTNNVNNVGDMPRQRRGSLNHTSVTTNVNRGRNGEAPHFPSSSHNNHHRVIPPHQPNHENHNNTHHHKKGWKNKVEVEEELLMEDLLLLNSHNLPPPHTLIIVLIAIAFGMFNLYLLVRVIF